MLVCEYLRIPLNVLKRSILAAAKASFLPDDEREELVSQNGRKVGVKGVEIAKAKNMAASRQTTFDILQNV